MQSFEAGKPFDSARAVKDRTVHGTASNALPQQKTPTPRSHFWELLASGIFRSPVISHFPPDKIT